MRKRLRELGIIIGQFPTGPHNAITDVPGVRVGHCTLISDTPRVARTGVTMVVPRNDVWLNPCMAGHYSFNGNGEMTGLLWLAESGQLGSPIGLTNTHQVGLVRDTLVKYAVEQGFSDSFHLPVVAETYDGWLNDIEAFHVQEQHIYTALAAATDGPVAEGNVGGGTGMICHAFKGGIGTASRLVQTAAETYTIGILVQANYGMRHLLRVDGRPIGRTLDHDRVPIPEHKRPTGNSIIVIVATDAPLSAGQCTRLAQRATIGLARVGGTGHNGSGDIFLAFATGNELLRDGRSHHAVSMLAHATLDPLFDAVAEGVEEAILNALCAAETMTGQLGRTVYGLPLESLVA